MQCTYAQVFGVEGHVLYFQMRDDGDKIAIMKIEYEALFAFLGLADDRDANMHIVEVVSL